MIWLLIGIYGITYPNNDDIDENCICVNHSFLFILGDIEDRSELDFKKPTTLAKFILPIGKVYWPWCDTDEDINNITTYLYTK